MNVSFVSIAVPAAHSRAAAALGNSSRVRVRKQHRSTSTGAQTTLASVYAYPAALEPQFKAFLHRWQQRQAVNQNWHWRWLRGSGSSSSSYGTQQLIKATRLGGETAASSRVRVPQQRSRRHQQHHHHHHIISGSSSSSSSGTGGNSGGGSISSSNARQRRRSQGGSSSSSSSSDGDTTTLGAAAARQQHRHYRHHSIGAGAAVISAQTQRSCHLHSAHLPNVSPQYSATPCCPSTTATVSQPGHQAERPTQICLQALEHQRSPLA